MRDNQRSKVYNCEHILRAIIGNAVQAPLYNFYGSKLVLPTELHFGSLAATQTYVDQVLGVGEVTVRAKQGNAWAYYCAREICVPQPSHGKHWAQRELVILHECAHHIAHNASQAHGPEFVTAFLGLLGTHMGLEVKLILSDLYHKQGVLTAQASTV